MKWCRFQTGQKVSYGIVQEDVVLEVSGSPFETYTVTSARYPLRGVKLLVPVIPRTFYAVGINYREHVNWAAERVDTQSIIPKKPDVGFRAINALIAH